MTLKLEFQTDTAAFEDDRDAEASRILHEVAERVAGGGTTGGIRDRNSSRIGQYEMKETV